jgi:hypothetical protein
MSMSFGVSKSPIHQQTNLFEKHCTDESDDLNMPHDIAEKMVGTAVIKVMEQHFAKL